MSAWRLCLVSGLILLFCSFTLFCELQAHPAHLPYARPVSFSARAEAPEEADDAQEEVLTKRKAAAVALYLLTLALLLMTFLLIAGIIFMRRRRHGLPKRAPRKTELEDLWWKIKDEDADADKKS